MLISWKFRGYLESGSRAFSYNGSLVTLVKDTKLVAPDRERSCSRFPHSRDKRSRMRANRWERSRYNVVKGDDNAGWIGIYPRLKIDNRRSCAASNQLNGYLRPTLVIEKLSTGLITQFASINIIFFPLYPLSFWWTFYQIKVQNQSTRIWSPRSKIIRSLYQSEIMTFTDPYLLYWSLSQPKCARALFTEMPLQGSKSMANIWRSTRIDRKHNSL